VPGDADRAATVDPAYPFKVSRFRAWLRRLVPVALKRVTRMLRGHEPIPRADFWDIGERLELGRHSYGQPLVRRWKEADDSVRVRIGSFVTIGEDVIMMLGSEHRVDRASTFPFRIVFGLPGAYEDGFPFSKGDIVIGSDVGIDRGARIFSGVTIGDGAVIRGSAVVTKDVRPYAIVAGNPAVEQGRRFSDEQVEALLRIRWWEWEDRAVLDAVPLLNDESRVDEFIQRYDPEGREKPA
jgi:acetyltransferase-like isoleucine patch superfamily enzyme